MSGQDESESLDISKNEVPVSELLRAKEVEVADNEVKPWHFEDLGKLEVKQQDQAKEELSVELRDELKAELIRQTSIIKKEAFLKAQKEGYEAGYQDGLEKGKVEAIKKTEQEAEVVLSAQVKSLQNLLESMSTPYNEISQDVFVSLAHLVAQLSAQVIQRSVEQNSRWIVECIQEAIEQLPESESKLTIELNEKDLVVVQKYLEISQHAWVLKANTELRSGTCRVKQDFSIVTNDWEERLSQLMDSFYAQAKTVATAEQNGLTSSPSSTPSS